MRNALTVTNPESAALFANIRQRHLLLMLGQREWNLAELARASGMRLNLLSHHMRRFQQLGLASVARESPRAGRAVKFYRAAAQAFFIPASLSPPAQDDTLYHQLRTALDLSRTGTLTGALYFHDGHGPRMRLVHDPNLQRSAAEFRLEPQ